MEAKELRIGNYILNYEAEPEVSIYWKVEEIQRLSNDKALNQTLGVTYRKGSCWTCDPEPIPLTEEWLVKFGFVKDKKHDNCCDLELENNFYLQGVGYGKSNIKYEVILTDSNDNELTLVKHVHQLQNLYFALTNEELTIKQ